MTAPTRQEEDDDRDPTSPEGVVLNERTPRANAKRAVSVVLAIFFVNGVLMSAHWTMGGRLGPGVLAVEAVLVVGVFTLLPRVALRWWLAATAAFSIVLLAILDLADAAAKQSLARPLNLYLDLQLIGAVKNLLVGAVGPGGAFLIALSSGLALAVSIGGILYLLTRVGASGPVQSRAWATLGLLVLMVGLAAAGAIPGLEERIHAPSVRIVRDQTRTYREMIEERAGFSAELAANPSSYRDKLGLLEGLGHRDVIVGFVESYGTSALSDSRYAPLILSRLDSLNAALDRAGVSVVSGTLEAPSQGGQSWLGHGSMLSGLWLDNQLRYDLLIASDRETLIDDFRAAGYRTVALVSAITMAWPEGARLGYDEIFDKGSIDYAGPPLNWVTMPDQFLWSFLETRVRRSEDPRPLFAELSLISSHAPWTPILPVLGDWDSIGDGAVFERWRNAGEEPAELWRDQDRVREHYALALDYALETITEYAVRFADERTLLIVLGDHQPAPLITGEGAERTVPIHVMSRDQDLLKPFLAWDFVIGTVPGTHDPVRRMDQFRDWFVGTFSTSVSTTMVNGNH